MDDSLKANFEEAASTVRTLVSKLPPERLLYLYARYKQALEGICTTTRPGFFDFQGKQKWDAWEALGEMPREVAMAQYVDEVAKLHPAFASRLARSRTELSPHSENDPQLVEIESEVHEAQGSKTHGSSAWRAVSSLAAAGAGDSDDDVDKTDTRQRALAAIRANDFSSLQPLLAQLPINELDAEQGMALLHWAADRGALESIVALLDAGAELNLQDREGQTALHYASSCGHEHVVRLLLERGADVSARDRDGQSALDVADDRAVVLLLQDREKQTRSTDTTDTSRTDQPTNA